MRMTKSLRYCSITSATTFKPGLHQLSFILAALLSMVTAVPETASASTRPSITPSNMESIGGDFTLHSADGPVALHDFRGKVVLLYFGYTHCPDACPTTLSRWRGAFNSLSLHKQEQVHGIFVSVDPGRDSPELLKGYVKHFHSNIVGITGTQDELQKVVAEYRAKYSYEKVGDGAADDYAVNHSGAVYVIDPTGTVRDMLTFQSSTNEIVTSIRAAMRVGY